MPRPPAYHVIDQMLTIMRFINSLAPDDPTIPGKSIRVEELAKRVGMSVSDVRRSIRLLDDCGDAVMGFFVDYDPQSDEVIPWHMDMAIDRMLGLTPHEAMALLTALDAIGLERDDPLAQKILRAVPPLTAERVRGMEAQAQAKGTADMLASAAEAITSQTLVRVFYRNPSGQEVRERLVEPMRLSYDLEESAWYLDGWCRDAKGWRTFRFDRMRDLEPTGEPFASHIGTPAIDNTGDEFDEMLASRPLATLAIHDPDSLGDAETWRQLQKMDNPSSEDEARLTSREIEHGAFIAQIPWIQEMPWLAHKIISTLGGVEALHPADLRASVHDECTRLMGVLDEDPKPADERNE